MDVFDLQAVITLDLSAYEKEIERARQLMENLQNGLASIALEIPQPEIPAPDAPDMPDIEAPVILESEIPPPDTKKFNISLSDIVKGAKKAANTISSAFNTAVSVFSAVGSAITDVGNGIWELANQSASAGDSIDKISQKIGISAESYQEWSYVFERSGANINGL